MTRDKWISDLRNAEDILQFTGEAMLNDKEQHQRWKFTYWMAVALYHLLLDKIRGV